MITVLADHNLVDDARRLWGILESEGWPNLVPMRLVTFDEVGLSAQTDDRTIWRFAQQAGMVLLTDNRNMEGPDSLEQTLREELAPHSFPVITIGRRERLYDSNYRERSAAALVEIAVDLEQHRGRDRLFIP